MTVFLEAKGHAAPAKTWSDPKEKLYHQFLLESSRASSGLFYVIPGNAQEKCTECVARYFSSASNVVTGFILSEDILDLLAPNLLEVAVDELVRVSKGLQELRGYQIELCQQMPGGSG